MLDGVYRWILASGTVIAAENGKPILVAGISQDITMEKQAKETLREKEALLRSFYDSPGILRGIVEVVDDDFLIISANPALAKILGFAQPGEMNTWFLNGRCAA